MDKTKTTKEKKQRVKRTPEQLAVDHRKNIAHDVGRIQHWAKGLAKRMGSKKYPISQTDIDKVLMAMNDSFKLVESVAHPVEKEADKPFSLD
jgi:hypothetical protein